MKTRLIAIDGPVAAGKSSVGSLLAKRLNYSFFDTGTMYRAFTWKALNSGISVEDESKLGQLARITKFDFILHQGETIPILIDNQDVSTESSGPEVEEQVSLIAKVAEVRRRLVSEQRKLAQRGELIMAGRDIGTVVLPWAELKVFLVASVKERAHRRHLDLLKQGRKVDYDIILRELEKRDEIDSHRAISPLKPAADAIIIDTEKISLEQVVDKIYDLVLKR